MNTKSIEPDIAFTLIYNAEIFTVQTNAGRYPSLMSLISDFLFVPGFGLCSGMGSCGSCNVNIDGDRTMSCGIAVDDQLTGTVIVIEQTGY